MREKEEKNLPRRPPRKAGANEPRPWGRLGPPHRRL